MQEHLHISGKVTVQRQNTFLFHERTLYCARTPAYFWKGHCAVQQKLHISVTAGFEHCIIQIYSGITCVRVLNGEFYTQKITEVTLSIYLPTGCFMNH